MWGHEQRIGRSVDECGGWSGRPGGGWRVVRVSQGADLANVVLADEINRTPRTQTALLEAWRRDGDGGRADVPANVPS